MRLILIDRAIGTIRETKTRKIHAGRENSVIRRLSGARECIGQNQMQVLMMLKTQDKKYGSGMKVRINWVMP